MHNVLFEPGYGLQDDTVGPTAHIPKHFHRVILDTQAKRNYKSPQKGLQKREKWEKDKKRFAKC